MHVSDKWGNTRLSSFIVATLKCVDECAAGLRFGGIIVEYTHTHDQHRDMRLVHGINTQKITLHSGRSSRHECILTVAAASP
jgi:hypothetical protein